MEIRIDEDTLGKIEKLAKLSIEDTKGVEKERILEGMEKMTEYFHILSEVPTEDVSPMVHPKESVNQWREEEPSTKDGFYDFSQNAPKLEERLLVVPGSIQGK